ncbi:MAG: pitrilysin family protein [Cyclobacteriaceae bacterium]|nr:pitrilysin family protein [Cyclobacteriaceae bacterium]
MKRIYILLIIASLGIDAIAQLDRTKAPAPGPAPEIKIGTPETFELKNGLKVLVVENHKLPRVAFNLVLNFEAIKEGDKAGYASLAGDMLRSGTKTRSKDQLDEEIDFIGATLATSATGIYAASLTKHQDALLQLMTDVLYNPSFPVEELEKLKKQTLSGLAAEKDDPASIASNVRSVMLYGKDHPYGELTTEETVSKITIDDCRNFYGQYYTPQIAYLAIVGDINLKDAKKLVKKYFGKWESKTIQLPKFSASSAPEKTFVALVDRSNSVQSEIRVAWPIVLKKGDPDVIKANLMNVILGSGFSSRLNQNLREKHAYTYGAGSSISSDMVVGNFNASTSVRNDVTDSAIYEIMDELKRIINETAEEKELASAKAYVTGNFSRSLEDPQTIASFALNVKRYGLPADYYTNYLKNVDAVTLGDIKAMAAKYIKPENANIIVVGKGTDVADKLAAFGEVKYYDIYGNNYVPVKSEIPAGVTASTVMEKYLEAIGGKEKAKTLMDMRMSITTEVQGMNLDIVVLSKAPNKSKTVVTMGGQTVMNSVFDGENASMSQMGQTVPVGEEQKMDMAFDAAIVSELLIAELGLEMQLTGIETIEGKKAYAVEITKPSGGKTTFYYDMESGLKVRSSAVAEGPQGAMVQNTDLSDYREVSGVKFPFVMILPMGPMNMTGNVQKIEVNTGISDSEFAVQ